MSRRLVRLRVAGALTALLLPVSAATAAPAAKCPPMLTDSSGDSHAPELDVVSADIRSNRKTASVTVTLSVAGRLGTNTLPGSKEWQLSWVLGDKAYQVLRRDDYRIDNGTYHTYYAFGNGHLSYDFRPAAIRVTGSSMQWAVPRAWLPELKKVKTSTFVNVRASTSSYGFGFDSARTSRVYADGAACSKEAPPP
jgi:hypothetical protein